MSEPYIFNYNKKESYATNFSYWHQVNTEEKIAYRETPYTNEEAIKVFREMYGEFENNG